MTSSYTFRLTVFCKKFLLLRAVIPCREIVMIRDFPEGCISSQISQFEKFRQKTVSRQNQNNCENPLVEIHANKYT